MSELIGNLLPFVVLFLVFSSISKRRNTKTKNAPRKKASSSVHAAVQPPVTTEPADMIDDFVPMSGSLGDDVHEGDDPCHPDEVHGIHVHETIPPMEELPSATTQLWNRNQLVNAFVMHEILTSPRERRRKT